jgi:hypothetical protein
MALDLASIQGWQMDRRRALALLTDQLKRAKRSSDFRRFGALHMAHADVDWTLRERAEAVITESVYMHYVHVRNPLQQVAA